jgi:aryl-alcohol dehydrogenase-like predicted oxidoreductase
MEYKTLGRTGLQVSVTGLGCNNFGMKLNKEQTAEVVNRAIDEGITLFDTADVYGGGGRSEEFLGEALGSRRHSIVLATKFSSPMGEGPLNRGGSRRYLMQAVEASLRRLGTDYIDLYQYHFPDASTPIEETLGALDDLVRSGKVRYIGSSNMMAWQVADADWTARMNHVNRFVTAQNEYSLLNRSVEQDLVPACRQFGIGILPYFPLASGFLTGKYRAGEQPPEGTRLALWGPRGKAIMSDQNFAVLGRLEEFAEARGKAVLDLAFGWLASQDFISSVIAGATTPEQAATNAKASEWKLTPEEIDEVSKLAETGGES